MSALICLGGALAAFCLPISNPDIFWHLSAGRWMAEHLAFPRQDWLSTTMLGRPWADFEWSVQLLWYGVMKAAGLPGLWFLKVLALSACAALLWTALGTYAVGPAWRGLAVFWWALGMTSANDLRPENLSVLLFIGLHAWLEVRRVGKWRSRGPRLEAACAALYFCVWANIHAGFLYGLVLLAIYAAVEAHRSRRLAWLCAAGAAAALLNPYGAQVYAVPLEHWVMREDLARYIDEWHGASMLNRWHWPFWAILFFAFIVISGRFIRRKDTPMEHVLAIAAFGLSASSHARTGVYFLAVAVPVAAAALHTRPTSSRGARCCSAAAELTGTGSSSAGIRARLAKPVFVFAFCLGGAFFTWQVLPLLEYGIVFNPGYAPRGAADFLWRERGALSGRALLNPWHWGGYLGWRLHPEFRVFVDGRYIFHHLLREMGDARRSPQEMQSFLDRHRVDVVVQEPERNTLPMTVRSKAGGETTLRRPAYLFFFPKETWALVYWDTRATVFVRRSAFAPGWTAGLEYELFRPDDLQAAFLKVGEGLAAHERVAAEVERFIAAVGEGEQADMARAWLKAVSKARK